MSWSKNVNQLLDEEEEGHNFCQEDEARKERDERTNENAIHEPRLTAVEQTMKKMMEECDKLYEVDRKKDRLDHAKEIRQIL